MLTALASLLLTVASNTQFAQSHAGPVKAAAPRAVHPSPVLETGAITIAADEIARVRTSPAPTLRVPMHDGASILLHLEPIDVLTPDATIVVASTNKGVTSERALSTDLRLFAVRVDGRTDVRGMVAVGTDVVGGFVTIDGRTIWLSSGPVGRGLPTVAFDASRADKAFLPLGNDFCMSGALNHPAPPAGGLAGAPVNTCREVTLAIDTDAEFTVNLFGGNENAAAAYALALTAATSEIYTDDLNVRLRVDYLRLWNIDPATDPWDQSSTTNQLFQFRDYWEANMGDVERDLTHFLSGRGLGGGVAWLTALCGDFNYGLSANLGGSFPYPLIDNSGANWDVMVYAHELGHNFGSPHTHSYDPPLDGCGNGDCSEAGAGTIMSYCHTCSGGLSNIALNFHPANIVTMSDYMNSLGCDYAGAAQPAIAMDDYAVIGAGQSASIDILFNDLRTNCESISISSFDATTANGATVTLVPAPPEGRPTFDVAVPQGAAAPDSFTYTITDSAGSSDSATVAIDVLPVYAATNVINTLPGVTTSYYEIGQLDFLPDFSTLSPYLTTNVTNVNFPSTGGNFASSGRADLVAAAFEGWVDVPVTGFYTFYSESDDGSTLQVNGQLVVSNDGLHGMVEKSGTVGLEAGKHSVRVEFFERFGGAGEIVRIQGGGLSKQVIPPSMWSRGGTMVTPDLNGDGAVNAADLAVLLGAWGSSNAAADLNNDGNVDAADLAALLGAWTN
ncbi:MAG: M12 family metallo-peptidase [Phycisphaerae bacterium]|nr:M12 family metallo-peptidase [Phycisphaerae bacterium]